MLILCFLKEGPQIVWASGKVYHGPASGYVNLATGERDKKVYPESGMLDSKISGVIMFNEAKILGTAIDKAEVGGGSGRQVQIWRTSFFNESF